MATPATTAQRPPENRPPLERFRDLTTELLLLTLSATAGMALVIALTWLGALPDPTRASWGAILSGPLLLGTAGATYLALERARDEPRPKLAPRAGRRPSGVGAGIVIALAAMAVATLGSIILSLVQKFALSVEVAEQDAIVQLVERGDPFEIAVLAVSAVVLAPITEELLFRGLFFRRLRVRVGVLAAWTLPALAFGLAHWNPVGLAIYIWLGTVFAFAYELSGRLWVAMLVHAGHNAFALTMLLVAPEALPG